MKVSVSRRIDAVKMLKAGVLLLGVVSAGVASAHAQAAEPFAGTWNWNAKATSFTDQRLTIKLTGNKTYLFDNHYGTPVTVVADGTPQKTIEGDTLSLEQVDADTWKSASTGRVSGSATYKVSTDGQGMKKRQTIVWADGGTEDRETDFRRLGSGKGLAGEWETKTFDSKSATKPFALIFTPAGDGRLNASMPAEKLDLTFMLDGKDYDDPTPGIEKGSTMATKRIGTRAIHVDGKLKGEIVESIDYEISPDGRTMKVRDVHRGQPKPILYTMEKQ